jgi:AraC family transcriptional regulator
MSEARDTKKVDQPLTAGQSYGNVLRKYDGCGLLLSEARHDLPRKLPKHFHELASFHLLLAGDYRESDGPITAVLKPFTTIFDPGCIPHSDEIGPSGLRIFTVELQKPWIDRLCEFGVAPATSVGPPGSELSWLAARLYREYHERRCYSALAIEGLVMEMMAVVGNSQLREKRAPAWLARVEELLHSNFQQNLTLKDVAAEVGLHPVYLSKVFRQFRHQPIGDYLHELRVRFVCQQLACPDISLAAIATAAGFSDQSHLTRVFKQFTGMTPGAFRATLVTHPNGDKLNSCISSGDSVYSKA